MGEAGGLKVSTKYLCKKIYLSLLFSPIARRVNMHVSLKVFFLFQYLGVATYLLGVCNELTAPAKGKKSKKKAANQSPEEKETTQLLNTLNFSLQSNLTNMEKFLDKLPAFASKCSLEDKFTKLSLKDYACPVESKIKNGFNDISNDVRNVLTKKVKYLASLIR